MNDKKKTKCQICHKPCVKTSPNTVCKKCQDDGWLDIETREGKEELAKDPELDALIKKVPVV